MPDLRLHGESSEGARVTIHQSIRTAAPAALSTALPSAAVQAPVDGWVVNVADEASALRAVIDDAVKGESFSLVTLNVDHLVKLREDEAFRNAYRAARYVTADGAPVARIARRSDPRVQRVTGADLFVPLCREAARAGAPVFFFGTSDDVLAAVSKRLREIIGPELEIVGTLSPRFGFDPDGPEADEALEAIRGSGARMTFILLGAPKQEIFAARAVAQGVPGGFACFGAAGDFVAGVQNRAPGWVQDLGFEAVWRFLSQPRRLGMRYLRCAALLASIELSALFRRR